MRWSTQVVWQICLLSFTSSLSCQDVFLEQLQCLSRDNLEPFQRANRAPSQALARNRLFCKVRPRKRWLVSEKKRDADGEAFDKGREAHVDNFATTAMFCRWYECQRYCEYEHGRGQVQIKMHSYHGEWSRNCSWFCAEYFGVLFLDITCPPSALGVTPLALSLQNNSKPNK